MATPGGKKPNKQQINDAGNEIGLDLANAIGKAISRALTSYDFSPLGKSITKSIGKIDVAGLLKTDDAKIKQLAANAKTTLESSIGLLKIGTEIDNDKLSVVQKTLQQLPDIDIKAAVSSVDTSAIEKEFAQIKPADIQAIVSSVDSSLIDSEINKLKPIDLQAVVTAVDSTLVDKETGILKPINLSATVGSVDTNLIQTELSKIKPADLQATVTSVDANLISTEVAKLNPVDVQASITSLDSSLVGKEVSILKPFDVLAKVASVDATLVDSEFSKLKPSELQARLTSVDTSIVDGEIGKINPIDLQAKIGDVDISLIGKETSSLQSIDLLAKISTVDSSLIGTETSKLKPIDLQAIVSSVDNSLIDVETGKLKNVELTAGIANLDTSLIDSTIGKLKSSELQATITSVNTDLIATEVTKVNPIELQAKVSSVDTSTLLAEISKFKPAELKALLTEVDTSLVDTEFGKLKIADLQALVTEVDTSLIGEEVNKLNPLALQAKLTELDSSVVDNMPQVGIKSNLEVDPTSIQSQLDKTPSAELKATVGEVQQPREDLFAEVEINPKIGKLDFDADRLISVVEKSFMRLNTTLSLIGATLRKEISSSPFDQMADGVEEVSTKSVKASSGFKTITDELKKLTSIFTRAFDAGLINQAGISIGKATLSLSEMDRKTTVLSDNLEEAASSATTLFNEIQTSNNELALAKKYGADRARVQKDIAQYTKEELTILAESLHIQKAQQLGSKELKQAIAEQLTQLDVQNDLNKVLIQSYEAQGVSVGGVLRNTIAVTQSLTDNKKVSQMLTSDAGRYKSLTAETAQAYSELTRATKQELVIAAQKLKIADADKLSKQELVGLVGNATIAQAEQNQIVQDTVSSYGDMDRAMKQVIADNKLKTVMVKTGLIGEYAETARLLELQREQGILSERDYATALDRVKAEHHVYEEKAKQLELTESLANWQLELKEELEDYEKGWEKTKSKIKAVLTDKEVRGSFLSVMGLEKIREGMKETVELFGEFRKEGLSVSQATKEMGLALGATFSLSGMSLKENAEIMAGMREQMGSMHHITSDTVTEVGKMAKTFGISAAEAGKLQGQFQNMPGATAESATNTLEFAGNLAKAAHVAPGDVMKDIAGNSESVAAYTKDGGKNIASAAVAAKKLGVEFGTLTKMSEGLLDFENSINKQMEASLLLGRSINLDKARQAALNGDIVGATQEMLANVGGEAEFNKMNVLQRKALADAMGVSVGELSKMVKHQDELRSLTEEQQMALATGEVTMDEILANAGGVADRFKDMGVGAIGALSSISQIKNGLRDTKGLLKDSVAGVKDFTSGFKAAREDGAGLFKGLIGGAREFMGLGSKIKETIPGADTLTEKATDTVKEKATDLVQEKATGLAEDKAGDLADKAADKGMEKVTGVAEDKAGDLAEKAAEGAGKLGDAAEKAPTPAAGMGVRTFLTNLAEGLKSFANGQVIKGAASMAFSLVLFGAGMAVFAKVLSLVPIQDLVVAAVALPAFAGGLYLMSKVASKINLGDVMKASQAMLILGGALTLSAFAFSLVGGVDPTAMMAFAGAMTVLMLAVGVVGTMGGKVIQGAAAIGIMAVSLIPAAFAFGMLKGVDPTAMTTFADGMTTLALATALLGAIGSNVIIGALALGILSVALIPAAFAFSLLEGVSVEKIIAFSVALPLLGLAAAGLGLISPFIAAGAIALGILGGGLIAISAGLLVLQAAEGGIKSLQDLISAFSGSEVLLTAAAGLAGIAGGLGLLGAAGLVAFPGLMLASIGLMAMVPGLMALNAVAQSEVITALTQSLIGLGSVGGGLATIGLSLLGLAGGLVAVAGASLLALPAIGMLAGVFALATVPMLMFGAAAATAGAGITVAAYSLSLLAESFGKLVADQITGVASSISTMSLSLLSIVPVLPLAAVGLGMLGAASLLASPGLLLASVGLGLMQLPLLAISAVAQSGAITQFAESLIALGTAGPGLLITSASLIALGVAGMFAFPGLTLVGAGLMAMVPGLFLVNQVAQADTLTALSQTLTALSAASGGLASVSASLFGIAGGLAAITLAGISAMPIIGALVGLAAVAPALASIGSLVGEGGGGGEAVEVEAKASNEASKDGSMQILIEEIRGLRAEIAKGGTINMDGRKVGEVVRLAMNTSGIR